MQLKEKTLKLIEEVNKNFATIHNILVEGEKQIVKSKHVSTEKEAHRKVRMYFVRSNPGLRDGWIGVGGGGKGAQEHKQ